MIERGITNMRAFLCKTGLLLAAAVFPAAAASAQDGDARVLQSNLDSAAAVFEEDIPADTMLVIDVVTTSDLDPVVTVTDAVTGELLDEDDDSGGDVNARAFAQGGSTGRRVVISVDSFDTDWLEEGEAYGGTFELRLQTRSTQPLDKRNVTYGSRVEGFVDGRENRFAFSGTPGDTLEVALIAPDGSDLDPYLVLRDAAGEEIVTDDDGGQGLNSYIRHTLDGDGNVTIVAGGFEDSTGPYLLRVRDRRTIPAQTPQQVIGIGGSATGELVGEYGGEGLGLSQIDYRLSEGAIAAIRRGEGELTVHMRADAGDDADFGGELDPFLELGFETPLGFAVVDSDDDGSGTLDALLPVDLGRIADRPELLRELRIRAKGLGGSGGAYTITVEPGLQARADEDYIDGEDVMILPPRQPRRVQ